MFDRVVNQLSAAAAATSTSGTSTTSAAAAAAILRYGGLTAPAPDKAEEPVREEDGQLNITVAEIMLKWHAESVGRCVELSPPSEVYVYNDFTFHILTSFWLNIDRRTLSRCCECWQRRWAPLMRKWRWKRA